MTNYQIITDSACDLPKAMLQKLGVTSTPLHVLYKGQNIDDTVEDAAVLDFYAGMRAGEVPTTSAVNPEGWVSVIRPALEEGKDVLVLAFSGGLSTTYQSAVIAASELSEQFPNRTIRVVDTASAALGQGLLVYHACQQRDKGLSLEELAAWVEANKPHVAHWFTVDDLVYLKRGGRVSAATAMLGTMLQIKPVLHVDEEGHLVSMVKARGRRASMDTLVKQFDTLGEGFENPIVFICHADCPEDAKKLEQVMLQKGVKEVFIGNLGAVIGSHAGPGTLALFFMGKHR